MRWMILSLLTCTGLMTTQAQTTALEQALFGLPDVIFKAIDTPDGYAAAYELHIKQPIDHNNPDKGHFYQRAFLSHRGFERPTVICTEGYTRSRNRVYELTNLIEGNQIDVEHRYFGSSMPAEKDFDYQYLNLEQATADLHHINQLFRRIYS
ncbi:MAG: S28 family serine protease, partial [Bacteroidota bacterium]